LEVHRAELPEEWRKFGERACAKASRAIRRDAVDSRLEQDRRELFSSIIQASIEALAHPLHSVRPRARTHAINPNMESTAYHHHEAKT